VQFREAVLSPPCDSQHCPDARDSLRQKAESGNSEFSFNAKGPVCSRNEGNTGKCAVESNLEKHKNDRLFLFKYKYLEA
jgi:hypothetical protein